jgi:hypothetical protein
VGGTMKFEIVKDLGDEKFRRLTGVKRTAFLKMILIIKQSSKGEKINVGRKNKMSIENMLLYHLPKIKYVLQLIPFYSKKVDYE